MKTLVLGLLLLLLSTIALATLPPDVSQEKLLANTDHVLIGRLIRIDMVNGDGEEIMDPSARTGPGLRNTIRFHVAIDEVCISTKKKVPPLLVVPLDRTMHYSLGQVQEAETRKMGSSLILLLKGSKFRPPFRGMFSAPIEAKEEILRMVGRKCRS
jgi:hypothetical protein